MAEKKLFLHYSPCVTISIVIGVLKNMIPWLNNHVCMFSSNTTFPACLRADIAYIIDILIAVSDVFTRSSM